MAAVGWLSAREERKRRSSLRREEKLVKTDSGSQIAEKDIIVISDDDDDSEVNKENVYSASTERFSTSKSGEPLMSRWLRVSEKKRKSKPTVPFVANHIEPGSCMYGPHPYMYASFTEGEVQEVGRRNSRMIHCNDVWRSGQKLIFKNAKGKRPKYSRACTECENWYGTDGCGGIYQSRKHHEALTCRHKVHHPEDDDGVWEISFPEED